MELSSVYFLDSLEVEKWCFTIGVVVGLFYMIFNNFSLIVIFHNKEFNCVKLASSNGCGGCRWQSCNICGD